MKQNRLCNFNKHEYIIWMDDGSPTEFLVIFSAYLQRVHFQSSIQGPWIYLVLNLNFKIRILDGERKGEQKITWAFLSVYFYL